ncbi:MAG: class I SAM-dependent methyltransferase [Hamadaea sp.]|uniref:class I SAM-dependent methyltransferase n=1 Tax=Hamadaea sp. NPDC050747 TaxID=3155789 RepID=UPI001855FF38|nr:class I SAM-dependent methyltransferase [Hamadaea sp.]NUR46876.1 class I SAM-dependent methyltransferase [Hamadaea sp.]NUT04830.1 class I SAM-dependent methyltransferase [Hamadaea sp.]
MNSLHDAYCSSPEWAEILVGEVLPWGLAGLPRPAYAVELGGGFGASTAYLLDWTDRLTVIEADATLADGLTARFPTADVRHADARRVPLPDGVADAVVCFTMLHHVTPAAAQDELFFEAARLLRPGGWFAGTDSLGSDRLREFHEGDVYEPLDPDTLPVRLTAAGFGEVEVEVGDRLRFRARR